MANPTTTLKKAYTYLVQTGIRRLLRHSPAELINRGIKNSQLLRFYIQSMQRISDILYFEYARNKRTTVEDKAKIGNLYFEQWKRSGDIIFNQNAERLKSDPKFHQTVNGFFFDFLKGSLPVLFETRAPAADADTKYPINLPAEFDDLKNSFIPPKQSQNPQVTVVYPFRDRDLNRLKVSVNSLYKNSSLAPKVIVVDYGSSPKYQQQLQELASKLDLRVIRTETYGLPWSRGRALNIGIKAATTEFVVTTDMDMIFDHDVLKVSIEKYSDQRVIHCRPLWLPMDGDRANAYLGNYDQLGGYMFIAKAQLEKLHGFTEEIEFWGLEDSELDKRMKAEGIESIWIDDQVSMLHIWHPLQYGGLDPRPTSSWSNSSHVFMASGITEAKSADWGEVVSTDARPILSQLSDADQNKLEVKDYLNQIGEVLKYAKVKKLIKLELGDRISPQTKEFIEFISYLSHDLNTYGVEVIANKNKNLDYFYLSLDLLQHEGMVDYFLAEEGDLAYLLFK